MRHQNTNGWWWFLIVIALSLFSFLSVSRFSFCCSSLQVLDIHHLSLIIRRIHTYIITSTSPRPPPCISTIQRIVFSFLIFIFFFSFHVLSVSSDIPSRLWSMSCGWNISFSFLSCLLVLSLASISLLSSFLFSFQFFFPILGEQSIYYTVYTKKVLFQVNEIRLRYDNLWESLSLRV